MNEIIVVCPAKVNLFLNIVGKENNMHLLKMVNQSVDLNDYIWIRTNKTGEINITCNQKDVPLDQNNSVFKAVLALKNNLDIYSGFDINIAKNIPIGSGLGGESTDAAGTILGITKMLNIDINEEDLLAIGAMVGSDVPFCLMGGTCFVHGIGNMITKVAMDISPMLIVKPNFDTNTKEMFKRYDNACLEYKEFESFIIGYNDFEIIAPKEIQDIRSYLFSMGAKFSNMTGSGSAVIGAFENQKRLLLAYKSLKHYFQNYQGYMVKPCDGIKVLEKTRLN